MMPMGQFGGDGCHLAVVEAAVDRCGPGGRQGGSWNVGAGVCLVTIYMLLGHCIEEVMV